MEETTEYEDFIVEGRGKVTEDELKSAWNMVMLDSMVTHLPFNIYVIECQMTDNPLSVLIPSDYNDPEYYFAVTVSDDPALVEPHTLLDVKLEAVDIQNAFRFIRHYEKYIRDFAKEELSVLDANYNAIHKGYTPVSKSYLIQRSVEPMPLNEMANVQKNKTGLPCDVWIDFNGSWRENTGHAYRFKVTDSKNKRKLSVTIPDLEFVNGTGSFSGSDISKIKYWYMWNADIFELAKYDQFYPDDLLAKIVKYKNDGIPRTIDNNPIIFSEVINSDYLIVYKRGTDYYNVMVDNKLISSQWFDSIERPEFDKDNKRYFPVKYTTTQGKTAPEYVKHTGRLYFDGTLVEDQEPAFNRKRKPKRR